MPNQQHAHDSAMDIRSLWGINGETFDYAERAYQSWQKGAEKIQTQAFDYFSSEMTKALEAMKKIAECQTAAEAIGVQSRYANEAMQGLIAESQRVIGQLASLTQSPWSIVASAENEAAETGKRAARGRS